AAAAAGGRRPAAAELPRPGLRPVRPVVPARAAPAVRPGVRLGPVPDGVGAALRDRVRAEAVRAARPQQARHADQRPPGGAGDGAAPRRLDPPGAARPAAALP